MKLHQNVGTIDRLIRFIGGVALLGLALAGFPAAPVSYLTVGVAFILLATAAIGFCPIYALLRVSTNRRAAEQR